MAKKVIRKLEDLPDENKSVVVDPRVLNGESFADEGQLQKFVYSNLKELCLLLFDDSLIEGFEELPVPNAIQLRMGPRGQRIDIYAKCAKKSYLIELKCPKALSENRIAIGQILNYGFQFRNYNIDPETLNRQELVIITTKFDISTARTIKYYKLPIRYFYLDRVRGMEYYGEA